MSAIAGLWSLDGRSGTERPCTDMLAALAMYGPDREARFSSGALSMGSCLLGLLPEDSFDRQPLSGGDVTALIADTRLDNRDTLARELGIASGEASRMADSEFLLAAWLRWGEDCLSHLTGAFAFAVWTESRRSLFLARDHTGERPLFYSFAHGHFAFSSMPKGLHALPFVPPRIDEDYAAHYLTLAAMPIGRTIFTGVERLPPGHALSLTPEGRRLWRYWDPRNLPSLPRLSAEGYLEMFHERFDEAVRARLRTTGNIGSELSGGLDSSSVTAAAARLLDGRPLHAFTAVPGAGFSDSAGSGHFGNEGPAAAETAALYPNIRHTLVESSATGFLDILDRNHSLYNHPCFSPSNEVWTNAIMDRARGLGVTVLLNGNCGNSTISSYGMSAFSAWFRGGRWLTLARTGWQLRRSGHASLKSVLRHAIWPSLPFWLRMRTDPHIRGFSLDYSVLHPAIAERLHLERLALHTIHAPAREGHAQLLNLLRNGDVGETTIAPQAGWRLDFRDPTFDRRIVEFCLALPLEEFLRGGQTRSLVRRAMQGVLPRATLLRRDRGRQSADWYQTMTPLRGRMLGEIAALTASPLARRMLNLDRMRALVQSWPSPEDISPETHRVHHVALTRGLSMGQFLRDYDPDRAGPESV